MRSVPVHERGPDGARPADTTPEAWELMKSVWRRMAPQERFELAASMSQEAKEMTLAGIRRKFPGASPEKILHVYATRCYGPELADAAFGPEGKWPCS